MFLIKALKPKFNIVLVILMAFPDKRPLQGPIIVDSGCTRNTIWGLTQQNTHCPDLS